MTNKFTKEDIRNTLNSLKLQKGEDVLIHSNIGLFGLLEGMKEKSDYFTFFKEAIFELIGEEGTLVIPTFTYSFCKKESFHVKNTKSTVGLFTEFAQMDPEAIRSKDGNFSVCAFGKNAVYYTENPPKDSFGKNSFWERFLKNNGRFLFFNVNMQSMTFVHYVEKYLNVPYRYDKCFKGNIIHEDDSVTKAEFFHFVMDLNVPERAYDSSRLEKALIQENKLKSVELGRGHISSLFSKDAFDCLIKGIKENSSFITKDKSVTVDRKSRMNTYFDRLWPINRSLTGHGVRKSFEILSEIVDFNLIEVPSGTKCFDWTVPPEWHVREAWIKDSKGNVIVDFKENNLHLLGYSVPFKGQLTFSELKEKLYTLPDQPELIPYLTSYYSPRWGFCMSQNQFDSLCKDETYEVFIDSTLDQNGSMTIGEAILQGESDEEILFSTYICHPSLANNELSGPLVSTFIYDALKDRKDLKYTYRFIFIPETIGSIYYLSKYGDHFKNKLKAGYVVTCIGDNAPFTYKRSRIGNSLPDRVAESILNLTEKDVIFHDFFPSGSDERQFCSPGFNLPVGSLMRSMYGKYDEYHTSGDDKGFISFEAMEGSVLKYLEFVEAIENNGYYINKLPFCEPQLGKRGLYPTLGSQKGNAEFVSTMMWILNLADGEHDLIDISNRSKVPIRKLIPVLKKLIEKGIVEKK